MKISTSQINDIALTEFASEVVCLLKEKKYSELADRFSYALAYGEDPSGVIKKEITSCLSQAGEGAKLSTIKPDIAVKYFDPNSSNLVAVAECILSIENGVGEVLVELIVAGEGDENYVTLEQISYAA